MTAVFRCLSCGHLLRAPEAVPGPSVRCPACGLVVPKPPQAPVPPEPSSPGEDERDDLTPLGTAPKDRSRPSGQPVRQPDPPADGARDWKRVRLGLLLLVFPPFVWLVALLLVMFAGGVTFAAFLASVTQRSSGDSTSEVWSAARVVVWGIGWVALSACHALTLGGHVCCLASPRENGARGLARGGLALAAVATLLQIGYFVVVITFAPPDPVLARPAGPWVMPAAGALLLGWFVADVLWFHVLLFYLRAVALSVRAEGLASALVGLLLMSAVTTPFLGVAPVWLFLGSLGGGMAGAEGGLLLMLMGSICLAVLLGLAVLIWWVVCQLLVRSAVGAFAAGGN